MLKVCMIVHQYYHRDGRIQRYAEALADAGAQVDVLCLRDPQRVEPATRPGIRVISIPLSRGIADRIGYLAEYGLALLLFALRLLPLYLARRHHVIHVHNMPDFLMFAALIPRLLGAKLILDIHDPMPEFYMSKYAYNRTTVAVRLMRLQERLSISLAHHVITANAAFRRNLINRGVLPEKIDVVENVADPRIFDRVSCASLATAPREHFTLIYPGTLAPRYGLEIAVRALPLLIDQIPNMRLHLVGHHTTYVTELLSLADELHVSEYVLFTPTVPIVEVPRLMAGADLGIYPAIPDPHMAIATPTKVLEYAFMGLPIVASRLPVLEERFPDTAVRYVPPGDVKAFAQAVITLYRDSTQRSTLVREADAAFVRTHHWSNERRVYFHVLNQLVIDQPFPIGFQESDTVFEVEAA